MLVQQFERYRNAEEKANAVQKMFQFVVHMEEEIQGMRREETRIMTSVRESLGGGGGTNRIAGIELGGTNSLTDQNITCSSAWNPPSALKTGWISSQRVMCCGVRFWPFSAAAGARVDQALDCPDDVAFSSSTTVNDTQSLKIEVVSTQWICGEVAEFAGSSNMEQPLRLNDTLAEAMPMRLLQISEVAFKKSSQKEYEMARPTLFNILLCWRLGNDRAACQMVLERHRTRMRAWSESTSGWKYVKDRRIDLCSRCFPLYAWLTAEERSLAMSEASELGLCALVHFSHLIDVAQGVKVHHQRKIETTDSGREHSKRTTTGRTFYSAKYVPLSTQNAEEENGEYRHRRTFGNLPRTWAVEPSQNAIHISVLTLNVVLRFDKCCNEIWRKVSLTAHAGCRHRIYLSLAHRGYQVTHFPVGLMAIYHVKNFVPR
ncbi:hypothetical protein BC629DRAFT_1442213 [Irpex lacteus]|nr:hypothetical protein BC629DRAFT_1442213 [Irpex lacteus]